MAGTKTFRFIQMAKETTSGTAVTTATALWRGKGTIEDVRQVHFVDEDLGYVSQIDRTYIPQLGAKLTFDATEANYEQLPYVFSAGVKNTTAGTADGSGSGYVWTYAMATTAQQLPQTYTIQGGDDQQAEYMEYSYVDAIRITGNAGEAVMLSADWLGRQVTNVTRNPAAGGLAIPTVEDFLFSKGSLYIDNVTGTMGTTQVSQTLLTADLSIKTGYVNVLTADGQIYFSFVKQIQPEVILTMTYEHNASAVAEKTNWRNQTARQIQLSFPGSTLTTAGTYTTKMFIVQLAGKYETWSKLGEQNGNDIVTVTFRARYDATAAKYATFIVVNQTASLV